MWNQLHYKLFLLTNEHFFLENWSFIWVLRRMQMKNYQIRQIFVLKSQSPPAPPPFKSNFGLLFQGQSNSEVSVHHGCIFLKICWIGGWKQCINFGRIFTKIMQFFAKFPLKHAIFSYFLFIIFDFCIFSSFCACFS